MKQPRHHTFTATIEQKIKSGAYPPGHRLPSVREIMAQYGLSATTVQNGYAHLVISGLVESIPKSGYYVSGTQPVISIPAPVVERDATYLHKLSLITSRHAGRRASTEFNVAAPGDLLIPQKLLLRTMQQVIREQGASLLRYDAPTGNASLRQSISLHLSQHHTMVHADELLITDGALQALYIALAAVCRPGDVVAVESPCIFSVLEVLQVMHLQVLEIPAPFQPDALEEACSRQKARVIIVTPNFHNPTGALLPDGGKQQLLAVAEKYNVPVIENDVYGDLHFTGQRPSNLKTFDRQGLVLTFSSFSKTLAPGIRLGWLAPGRYYKEAEQVRFSLGSAVSPVYQAMVQKLLATGSYQRHVRTFRARLARNAAVTQQLLAAHFPQGTVFSRPEGGYSMWVEMPAGTDMQRFYEHFTPGYNFTLTTAFRHCFRLVFAEPYTPARKAAIQAAAQLYR